MRHVVLGTNNIESAIEYYNALFEGVGEFKTFNADRMHYWLFEDFTFAIAIPFDENPATNGNGTMIGFDMGTVEEVQRLYKRAIELGGTCEGEPSEKGPRFSGYVRDLDNNKLCFYK